MSGVSKADSDVTTPPEIHPVTARLRELGLNDEQIAKIRTDLGVETIDDLAGLKEADLVALSVKPIPARRLISALTTKAAATVAESAAAGAVNSMAMETILPAVPTDASWLEMLKAGGVLKVDQSTVISAVRAALAHRARLFDIPDKLAEAMEKFADTNEEQVDPAFFALRKQLTRRSYAEVFAAIDGLDGSFVTEGRKKQLLARVDEKLWPAIIEFHTQLKAWQEAWMQGAANPMMLMGAFLTASGGGGVGIMPPGMMAPPDTGSLRDHADAVADSVNRVFAGTGVQIAAALAYDATQIRITFENPRLPAMIGAANRDQMLRQLGVAVNATYPRLETNLTRYVLAVMNLKDQPEGNDELQYLGAMFMLGSQIPWDQLGGPTRSGKLSGIGGRRPNEL